MSSGSSEVGAAGVHQGDVLAGKYRVDRVLGVGGMGVVVAAHHLHLDEQVAIKFLHPEAMRNPEAVARFDREARSAVKIKSEHVARVTDVGKLENGSPYMVMEYLEGRDLAAWLVERGPLPVEQAVEFILQACEAVAEAHSLGIVHRDLKPANLYCIRRPDGGLSIKVLDFGISKVTGGGMGMTSTQSVMGSPLYMSPEQMESSKAVDVRSDIWALGIILFELLTGRTPFEGAAITELVLKIVTASPPPLQGMSPGMPPGLDPIIARCLEKKRELRYANIGELANALIAFGPSRARLSVERIAGIMNASVTGPRPSFHSGPPPAQGAQATRAITGGAGGPPPPAANTGASMPGMQLPAPQAMTDGSWGQTGGAARGASRLPVVLGVAAVLALVGVGATWMVMKRPSPTATAASSPALVPPAPSAPPPAATDSTTLAPLEPSPADSTSLSAVPNGTPPPVAPGPARPGTPTVRPGGSGTNPPTKPKANCDPPYFIDAAGHRQYKPECL